MWFLLELGKVQEYLLENKIFIISHLQLTYFKIQIEVTHLLKNMIERR